MSGPLSGFRILDLSTVLMGPSATQMLADMGAEVIKLEPPAGDTSRHVGPGRHADMGSNFLHMNRGKRSIAVDLKTAEGREIALRLAQDADALVHNIRTAAMDRLGLTVEAVRARSPAIVYCHLVGYPADGSRAGAPAYDDLIQAAVGLPWLIERTTGEPGYVPTPIADRTAGLCAAFAICAALLERERTGLARSLTIPMYDVMAHMVLSDHMYGATFLPEEGQVGYERLISPHRKPYATGDGHVCLLIYTDDHWRRFFSLIGRPELAQDPRFAGMRNRNRNIDALNGIVAEALLGHSTDAWLALLGEADIPATRMRSVADLVDDPDLYRSGTLDHATHPSEGPMRVLNSPVQWEGSEPDKPRFAPRLGQHSREVLREAGYSLDEIGALVDGGIVVVTGEG